MGEGTNRERFPDKVRARLGTSPGGQAVEVAPVNRDNEIRVEGQGGVLVFSRRAGGGVGVRMIEAYDGRALKVCLLFSGQGLFRADGISVPRGICPRVLCSANRQYSSVRLIVLADKEATTLQGIGLSAMIGDLLFGMWV